MAYTKYEPIEFENGILVSPAKVDQETGVITPPVYSGNKPIGATTLNHLEQGLINLEDYATNLLKDSLESNSTTNAPSICAINKKFNKVNGVLLWENPLPGNEFGGQKVELDLSKYKFIVVEIYRYNTTGPHIISTILFSNTVGQIFYIDYENEVRAWNRHIQSSSTGCTFGDATLNGVIDNYALVPYRIWAFE